MRKLFVSLFVALIAMVMGGCGTDNTPAGVAEASIKCIQKEDINGYLDLLEIDNSKSKDTVKGKEELAALLSSKVIPALRAKGGIKSYKVMSEEINETGDKAKVTLNVVYGNGEEDEQVADLVKNENGEWKLKLGK